MRRNHTSHRRKLDRYFIEDEYFVEANLNMVVELGDDMNPPQTFGNVQRLIFLSFGNVAVRDSSS
jgi:hypothetical protein